MRRFGYFSFKSVSSAQPSLLISVGSDRLQKFKVGVSGDKRFSGSFIARLSAFPSAFLTAKLLFDATKVLMKVGSVPLFIVVSFSIAVDKKTGHLEFVLINLKVDPIFDL